MSILMYSRWNGAESWVEFSAKMALFWLFCLLSTHASCQEHEIIIGVVVPVACLKTTTTNTSDGQDLHLKYWLGSR